MSYVEARGYHLCILSSPGAAMRLVSPADNRLIAVAVSAIRFLLHAVSCAIPSARPGGRPLRRRPERRDTHTLSPDAGRCRQLWAPTERTPSSAFTFLLILLSAFSPSSECRAQDSGPLRPSAAPLVTHDPYLSVWSMSDRLTDSDTRHWTNRVHPLRCLIRVDGKPYRVMGAEPKSVPAMTQKWMRVSPTSTTYAFEDGGVIVVFTFTTPALPDDIDMLTRPVTYLTWMVRAYDAGRHSVQILQTASALLSVHEPNQVVEWSRPPVYGQTALRVGTVEQPLLRRAGDDTRIDWGYLYGSAPEKDAKCTVASSDFQLDAFARTGKPHPTDLRKPRRANDDEPILGFAFDLGTVTGRPVTRHMTIAYDELYAVRFLGRKLRPYWRRNGATAADLLRAAERDYITLMRRSSDFSRVLMADLTRAGGERYAQLCALAYRQTLAGCGWAADANGQPLIFTKENTSNGCIATTDVFYPAAPQFLLMGPAYAKALVAPVLIYSTSPRWKFPFAPHDIGVYPSADAQVYGGGESPGNEADKMPVEESANMILLCDAIARMEGNARFASRWWPQLTRWEKYLEKYGLDPEDQLCTDDFMGHLAHNANLSVKAILAIAAYGDLCRMPGGRSLCEEVS